MKQKKLLTIKGLVQGIGYRPFVAREAEKRNIVGWVRNTSGIVTVLAIGYENDVSSFVEVLKTKTPPGGFIESVEESVCDLSDEQILGFAKFTIIESNEQREEGEYPVIPPDIATCEFCEEEVFDEANSRFSHPFISCVSCGPRYSIIEKLPYDRPRIVMKKYEMCESCKSEYAALGDRRRHAQTIACKKCGPVLYGYYGNNINDRLKEYAAIEEGVRVINAGGILAMKDIGGFHFACSPFDEKGVTRLRNLKGRERKPFAVMFADMGQVEEYCELNDRERALLQSPARPIVLLNRKNKVPKVFSYNVCDTSPSIGAMLPCNPLQLLLLEKTGPLIMTSANPSGGLLATEWKQERFSLGSELLYVLDHGREILVPLEDSIKRIVSGHELTIRRARGYVPMPMEARVTDKVLALGGDLKSVFCYTGNNKAYISTQFGDLEDEDSFQAFENEIIRMKELFGFSPELLVCDMHPGYISSGYADKLIEDGVFENCQLIKIQHHKAHVASVIAEYDIDEAVCFAFDGTGYGEDGAIWGSEVFIWENQELRRYTHLDYVSLPASDSASKNTKLSALGYLAGMSEEYQQKALGVLEKRQKEFRVSKGDFALTNAAVRGGVNRVGSSSMGRLFDAVSFLLGICAYNQYEGEAPIEMEYSIGDYPLEDCFTMPCTFSTNEILEHIIDGLIENRPVAELSAEFHLWLANSIVAIVKKSGKSKVVLSGGTFLNKFLFENTEKLLKQNGCTVFISSQLPVGDGGICLGQAFLGSRYLK